MFFVKNFLSRVKRFLIENLKVHLSWFEIHLTFTASIAYQFRQLCIAPTTVHQICTILPRFLEQHSGIASQQQPLDMVHEELQQHESQACRLLIVMCPAPAAT